MGAILPFRGKLSNIEKMGASHAERIFLHPNIITMQINTREHHHFQHVQQLFLAFQSRSHTQNICFITEINKY